MVSYFQVNTAVHLSFISNILFCSVEYFLKTSINLHFLGVGVYDSDDEEVYTSEDLSKYDYAIGKGAQNLREVERCKPSKSYFLYQKI